MNIDLLSDYSLVIQYVRKSMLLACLDVLDVVFLAFVFVDYEKFFPGKSTSEELC